jgi:hypothetical protein
MWRWLAGALMILLPLVGFASEPEVYDYRIHHSLHGDIGHHRMTVTREDDGRILVHHQTDIEVRLLSALMYSRHVEIKETWEDDQLVSFEAVVDDDGRTVRVEARQDGQGLLVDGGLGVALAPGEAAPQQPSFERAIARPAFFAIETGEVFEAEVAKVESDGVEIGGSAFPATKYTLAGGRDDRVWFTSDGLWAKWELDRGGGVVTLIRE